MHILFSCFPGLGHVGPTMGLARAARRAGHRVLYVVAPENAGWVRDRGFDAQPAGLSHQEVVRRWRTRYPETGRMTRQEQFQHLVPHALVDIAARAKVVELTRLIRDWGADLLVSTTSDFSGPVGAEAAGVRHVRHGVTVARPAGETAQVLGESLTRLAADHGVSNRKAGAWASTLSLDITPPSLAIADPARIGERQPLRPIDAVHDGRPPPVLAGLPHEETVYVTLGTVVTAPRLIQLILASLAQEDLNLLVTVGSKMDPSDLGILPRNVRVESFVPQEEILAHCSAVVCHGGAGTTLGALAHGRPLLLFPRAVDQFRVAERSAAAGAAIVLTSADYSTAGIRAAFRRLRHHDGHRASARRVAAEIAAMPPPEEVLSRLESGAGRPA
jgi:UDP:flavonoid glycosyltransferase YjiC (YdhE family)